jgi:hypothetical protein
MTVCCKREEIAQRRPDNLYKSAVWWCLSADSRCWSQHFDMVFGWILGALDGMSLDDD